MRFNLETSKLLYEVRYKSLTSKEEEESLVWEPYIPIEELPF
ncbi:hypothetical protein [uncultured Clostridium sp.]|nr:hypothetical protein [uncultured Clostridium sp.]